MGPFEVAGTVYVGYYGRTNDTYTNVFVEAYPNRGLGGGEPLARCTVDSNGVFRLRGLESGSYYLMAYIDDGNEEYDMEEPFGFVPQRSPYDIYEPGMISVPPSVSNVAIVIRSR